MANINDLRQWSRLNNYPKLTYPLVYDDSLTVLQKLHRLLAVIGSIIEYLDGIEDDWKSYTDEQIALLKKYVDAELARIDSEIANIKIDIERIETDLNNKIQNLETELLQKLKEFQESINLQIQEIKNLLLLMEARLNNRIDDRFRKLLRYIQQNISSKMMLINPWTGFVELLQNSLDDIHKNDEIIWGLTSNQIKKMNKTAQWWGNQPLLARDVAWNIQNRRRFQRKALNPVTNQIGSYQQVFKDLYNLHLDPFTAQQIADMNMTAQQIADENKTAYQWAFKGGSTPTDPATEGWVNERLNNYLALSGGTITGNLSVNGTITGSLNGNASIAGAVMRENLPVTQDIHNLAIVGQNQNIKFYWTASAVSMTNVPNQILGKNIGFSLCVWSISSTSFLLIMYVNDSVDEGIRGIYTSINYAGTWVDWEKFSDIYATKEWVIENIPSDTRVDEIEEKLNKNIDDVTGIIQAFEAH